jgi:competence protein ComEC
LIKNLKNARNSFIFSIMILILGMTTFCVYAQTSTDGTAGGNDLAVSFINVGQGDCILIHTPTNQNILIDAGNREDFPTIQHFLQTQNVSRLDVVVATHPHEDHIGSMEQIIRSFEIGKIYMPKVAANTRAFEDLLLAVKAKGLKINGAKAGLNLELEPSANGRQRKFAMEFLAPNSDFYENMNDYSAVIKLTYCNVSFLFMGDAGKVSEQEILSHDSDLKANILKVGHHGSSSSSCSAFLQKVVPNIAIISVGLNNSYHHPSLATLKRLDKVGAKIYRTDRNGTIQVLTDGNKLVVHCVNE